MRRPADNPFRSQCIDNLEYIPDDKQLEELYQQLKNLSFKACLLGQHGSGKTCLLDAIEARLTHEGHQSIRIHINGDLPKPSLQHIRSLHREHPQACICIDGADSFSRYQWHLVKWSLRRSAGLIVTSHERPLLQALHRQRSNPDTLRQIILRLAGPTSINVQSLWEQHAGNLRNCLRQCYLDWQAQRI